MPGRSRDEQERWDAAIRRSLAAAIAVLLLLGSAAVAFTRPGAGHQQSNLAGDAAFAGSTTTTTGHRTTGGRSAVTTVAPSADAGSSAAPTLTAPAPAPSSAVAALPTIPTIPLVPVLTKAVRMAALPNLKLMNYFPSTSGWGWMWSDWDIAKITSDFSGMAGLGATGVRLIVQPSTFGYPAPAAVMQQHLAQLVALAAADGMQAQITLFDLWESYADVAGSKIWAGQILAPFKNDPRVSSIELQNEMDSSDPTAMAWARAMIPVLRADAGNIPITVSAQSDLPSLVGLHRDLGAAQPDFYSYHYYGPTSDAADTFKLLKSDVSPLPAFIGETGVPSCGTLFPNGSTPAGEAAEANYYAAVFAAARQVGLPRPAPWIYEDFAKGVFPGPNVQQYYGLLRSDGSLKPAAAVVRSAFAAG